MLSGHPPLKTAGLIVGELVVGVALGKYEGLLEGIELGEREEHEVSPWPNWTLLEPALSPLLKRPIPYFTSTPS